MAAIGSDLLSIGSSKWQQQLNFPDDGAHSFGPDAAAPSHFMLPAVDNVSGVHPANIQAAHELMLHDVSTIGFVNYILL